MAARRRTDLLTNPVLSYTKMVRLLYAALQQREILLATPGKRQQDWVRSMLSTMFNAWWPFTGPWHELPQPIQDHQRLGRKAGNFASHCFTGDARPLRYKLFIPSAYQGQPLPLIVMLHGCGQDADDFAMGTGMNELAEEYQCLVLYPEQSSDANWNRCWNWFEGAHH